MAARGRCRNFKLKCKAGGWETLPGVVDSGRAVLRVGWTLAEPDFGAAGRAAPAVEYQPADCEE